MQLKQHKLNGNGELREGLCLLKCVIVREVFVPKRAVLLGEHANKTVTSVWSTQCNELKMSFFPVSRHVLKGVESAVVDLTQGVVCCMMVTFYLVWLLYHWGWPPDNKHHHITSFMLCLNFIGQILKATCSSHSYQASFKSVAFPPRQRWFSHLWQKNT